MSVCKCGNKTRNKGEICSSCRQKIQMLNQIRKMVDPTDYKPNRPIKKKEKRVFSSKGHSTLCWTCEKACGRCSWSKDFLPVDGWSAIPTKILVLNTKSNGVRERIFTDSFDVYYCPEFELLEMLR